MFKKAREHGAESVDPNSGASGAAGGASSRPTFVGSGHTLGSGKYSNLLNKRAGWNKVCR